MLGVNIDRELVDEVFHLVAVREVVFQSLWKVLQVDDPQVAVQAVQFSHGLVRKTEVERLKNNFRIDWLRLSKDQRLALDPTYELKSKFQVGEEGNLYNLAASSLNYTSCLFDTDAISSHVSEIKNSLLRSLQSEE